LWPLPLALLVAILSGCATVATDDPARRSGPPGLIDLLDRPAERSLLDGLRAYEDGQYTAAEKALRQALAPSPAGTLAHPRDRATAHKLLAFIQCTSNRTAECEAEFRAARQANPGFALSRAEAGHPLWGPVYRRSLP
jgi:Tfp pilus assembly protein PilF